MSQFDRSDFERDFMHRTQQIVEDYEGPFDATLLLNSLLGLLVVPREKMFEKIPMGPVEQWMVPQGAIKRWGKSNRDAASRTLKHLVQNLRNAVAHFQVEPLDDGENCIGFSFGGRNGFCAEFKLAELKDFAIRLAEHLVATSDAPTPFRSRMTKQAKPRASGYKLDT